MSQCTVVDRQVLQSQNMRLARKALVALLGSKVAPPAAPPSLPFLEPLRYMPTNGTNTKPLVLQAPCHASHHITVKRNLLYLHASNAMHPCGLGSPSRPKALDNARTPLEPNPTF